MHHQNWILVFTDFQSFVAFQIHFIQKCNPKDCCLCQTHCLTAALESFKQGLEYARSNCGYEDKEERIADTLEAFEHCDKNKLFPKNVSISNVVLPSLN